MVRLSSITGRFISILYVYSNNKTILCILMKSVVSIRRYHSFDDSHGKNESDKPAVYQESAGMDNTAAMVTGMASNKITAS